MPMMMRHRAPSSLDLGMGERPRGYAQHQWPNRTDERCWHQRWRQADDGAATVCRIARTVTVADRGHGRREEKVQGVTPSERDELIRCFPERHYVPLIEILATVNLHTEFATELRHLRQTHVRQVSEKILFAGVIGLGCAIGSTKMAQISTSLSAAELDSAINWRFLLENLCATNNPITGFITTMDLPQHLSPIGE